MLRRPPPATLTDTLCPYPTLVRLGQLLDRLAAGAGESEAEHHDAAPLRLGDGPASGGDFADHLSLHPHLCPTCCGGHLGTTEPFNFFRHRRSEEHTSEHQSLMRISYAVFCLKKKKNIQHKNN